MNSMAGRKLRALFLFTFCLAAGAPYSASAREILFSSEIPISQAQRLSQDLATPLGLVDDNPAMKEVMGLNDLSDGSLKAWLTARVGYIIGENEDPSEHLFQLQKYVYQNAGIFPDFEKPAPMPSPTPVPNRRFGTPAPNGDKPKTKVALVMSNVGTIFYYFGKHNDVLLGYDFVAPEQHVTASIRSPRIGIIRIGQGLFSILLNTQNPDSLANVYFRLATLFHEAHHSDGNGKSLGFPHAVCPKGSDYYNLNACDRNGNGPYIIGAFFLRQAALTCAKNKTCTNEEYERLALAAVDSYSRVIDKVYWDSTPEGL